MTGKDGMTQKPFRVATRRWDDFDADTWQVLANCVAMLREAGLSPWPDLRGTDVECQGALVSLQHDCEHRARLADGTATIGENQ